MFRDKTQNVNTSYKNVLLILFSFVFHLLHVSMLLKLHKVQYFVCLLLLYYQVKFFLSFNNDIFCNNNDF